MAYSNRSAIFRKIFDSKIVTWIFDLRFTISRSVKFKVINPLPMLILILNDLNSINNDPIELSQSSQHVNSGNYQNRTIITMLLTDLLYKNLYVQISAAVIRYIVVVQDVALLDGNNVLGIFNLNSLRLINDKRNIEYDIMHRFNSQGYIIWLNNSYNELSWVGNIDSDKMIVFDVNLDVCGLLSYVITLISIKMSSTTQLIDSTDNIQINDSISHIYNNLKIDTKFLPILFTISEI